MALPGLLYYGHEMLNKVTNAPQKPRYACVPNRVKHATEMLLLFNLDTGSVHGHRLEDGCAPGRPRIRQRCQFETASTRA